MIDNYLGEEQAVLPVGEGHERKKILAGAQPLVRQTNSFNPLDAPGIYYLFSNKKY